MRYRLSIPARINILGNPGDANEGDFATISAAVDLRAGALVEPWDGVCLEIFASEQAALEGSTPLERAVFQTGATDLPYNGSADLLKAGVNVLYGFSPRLREAFSKQGIRLAAWTQVPRQSGLGGSTLFVLMALAGLRAFYNLDLSQHNDYILSELAQRAEANELNIACGYADRYVPLFGGLAYIDYRGKLHQGAIRQEPYATYERLDAWVDDLPVTAISTGVVRQSGDVHGLMRPRYIQEHDAWQAAGGSAPPMVRFMSAAWETAWRGKIALLEGDLPTFGSLMNDNHRLVDEMMSYCGFEDGAGWANNLMIKVALEHGALGAKLTGAGSGGSVFALVRPGEEASLLDAWQTAAAAAGLENATVFRPRIDRQGLEIRPAVGN